MKKTLIIASLFFTNSIVTAQTNKLALLNLETRDLSVGAQTNKEQLPPKKCDELRLNQAYLQSITFDSKHSDFFSVIAAASSEVHPDANKDFISKYSDRNNSFFKATVKYWNPETTKRHELINDFINKGAYWAYLGSEPSIDLITSREWISGLAYGFENNSDIHVFIRGRGEWSGLVYSYTSGIPRLSKAITSAYISKVELVRSEIQKLIQDHIQKELINTKNDLDSTGCQKIGAQDNIEQKYVLYFSENGQERESAELPSLMNFFQNKYPESLLEKIESLNSITKEVYDISIELGNLMVYDNMVKILEVPRGAFYVGGDYSEIRKNPIFVEQIKGNMSFIQQKINKSYGLLMKKLGISEPLFDSTTHTNSYK